MSLQMIQTPISFTGREASALRQIRWHIILSPVCTVHPYNCTGFQVSLGWVWPVQHPGSITLRAVGKHLRFKGNHFNLTVEMIRVQVHESRCSLPRKCLFLLLVLTHFTSPLDPVNYFSLNFTLMDPTVFCVLYSPQEPQSNISIWLSYSHSTCSYSCRASGTLGYVLQC